MLRSHVRCVSKFEHLREELAELLLPVRDRLVEEFAFLWKDKAADDGDPSTDAKLSNREILMRICRRIFSKRLIGACHGPWDRIYRGFPEHDKGRAKEATELLVKAGVLRKKPSVVGPRVSIEPKMLGAVEQAIAGRPTGLAALDEWCAAEAAR